MTTVLLATYNPGHYLREQISSIRGADEILISDDCSTDGTPEEIKSGLYGPGVTLVSSGIKFGSAKRNFSSLLSECRSEYAFFSDQDDVWLPEKIPESLRCLKLLEEKYGKDTPLLVFSDSEVVSSDLSSISKSLWQFQGINPKSALSFKRLVVQNVAQGCTMCFNAALMKKAQTIPDDAIMHDWWLMLVAAAFGKIGVLDKATMLYRQHGNNEVGAKPYTLIKSLTQALRGRSAALTSLNKTQLQAAEFCKKYGSYLTKEQYEFLHDYSVISQKPFLSRKFFCLRNKLAKCGTLRTLGLYYFI